MEPLPVLVGGINSYIIVRFVIDKELISELILVDMLILANKVNSVEVYVCRYDRKIISGFIKLL